MVAFRPSVCENSTRDIITLTRVSTEMSLHVLAFNMKRMMNIFGPKTLIEAIGA